jgi:hypothetical protein
MAQGAYGNTMSNNIVFIVPNDATTANNFTQPLLNGGEVVVILESKDKGADGKSAFEIYGIDQGLTMTAGERNIAVGTFALNQLIRGTKNIAIGADAMYRTAYAHKNVAIGKAAAGFTHADPSSHKYEGNTAIGYNALGAKAKDYNDNTAVGANAMGGNIDDTISRERNVAVGYEACHYGVKENVAVGHRADRYTKGSNNVAVGNNTGDISETGNNNVLIGSNAKIKSGEGTWQSQVEHNNTIVIGANAVGTKSNQVVIGNAQQTEVILLGNKRIIFNADGTVTWEPHEA